MRNDYYDIAYNDLLYLEEDYHKTNYNPMVIMIQQVVEKMLKSVLELTSVNIEFLLHSNNLKQIYEAINKVDSNFSLNKKDLVFLKDFYFEAKYPGDNFIVVSREDCEDCLRIMYTVIKEVNDFRKRNNLEYYEVDTKRLKPLNEQNIDKSVVF